MTRITSHILDTSRGRPAEGVKVTLCRMGVDRWEVVARGQTNADGRVADWAAADSIPGNGVYIIRFETKDYFDRLSIPSFYPFVEVYFEVTGDEHYHIPLLLSPYGYSTYRGS
jgi:5-hydroxyisourate hydrolase